jgi:hypothetical protein
VVKLSWCNSVLPGSPWPAVIHRAGRLDAGPNVVQRDQLARRDMRPR